ncbi:MAG: exodeoxyribonuclease VII large subunit [Deltaproteobacteria bacterium]|nr:exodeoxyribonuclease VII large subunit [Deltaproteobacteria bacterium]
MKIYTVSELTKAIKDRLESEWPEVWIEGEVSNFKQSQAGHSYFTLKDERSQIRAVLFRGNSGALRFSLQDGLSVLAYGHLSVYELRGEYQIIVDHLEPKGWGALQLAFEQLKKKLEAEGLFDPARKRPLPFLPQKIGIVTSPTGAAIRDMLQILTRRYPTLEILIAPVAVQGREAAAEIAAGIEALNQEELDLIIIGRGGGSLEDLWAFNEEIVARAIYHSRLPVISAVGHETDFTIADFVADLRAPTPSAAAELAVPVKEELQQTILQLQTRLKRGIQAVLEEKRLKLKQWIGFLRDPRRRLEELLLRVDSYQERIRLVFEGRMEVYRETVQRLQAHLKSLGPLAVLERGYAIAIGPKGKALRDSRDVDIDDRVKIQLARGSLETLVKKRDLL